MLGTGKGRGTTLTGTSVEDEVMGTQGLVSVIDQKGRTLLKVVAGCNGDKAGQLGEVLRRMEGRMTLHRVLQEAMIVGFGCRRCRVAMDGEEILTDADDEPGKLYRMKFNDPEFNPRWEHGTADYCVVVIKKKGGGD